MSGKLSHRGEEKTFSFDLRDGSAVIISVRAHSLESFISRADSHGFSLIEGAIHTPIDEPSQVAHQDQLFLLSVKREEVEIKRHLRSMKPLYYAKFNNMLHFASERKALWEVGIQYTEALQPGERLKIKGVGKRIEIDSEDAHHPAIVRNTPRKDVIKRLAMTLKNTFKRIAGRRIGVLFSGGIDSSLVALLAQEVCQNVQLYSASSQRFHDRMAASSAAETLGMHLNQIEINADVVWDVLPNLLYSVESAHLMDIEIAIPFYLASSQAASDGVPLILSGQGPDELFAGYARHVRIFEDEGEHALDTQLWHEVMRTHEANIERDDRAIAIHGLESFFPYLTAEFIDLALSIPSGWKVSPGSQPERKIIFRELARQLGLSQSISDSPKKATQYSSGSSRILMKSLVDNVAGIRDTSRIERRAKAQEYLNEMASELGMLV
ncbi:MAG: asparagine synthase C-terminal domain-containing protein [Candidatus Thorarchaeota archaeon]|jgi:asparagine synthase (glutamine-hydrolysing)